MKDAGTRWDTGAAPALKTWHPVGVLGCYVSWALATGAHRVEKPDAGLHGNDARTLSTPRSKGSGGALAMGSGMHVARLHRRAPACGGDT
ncbi:hypothetical protein VTK73DRAFT_3454 [Phialemonium thermophilum]|uniref:Uncharacterized protein n=1 Tax=Phialemonium thermophilum TaxID=223376 RepID=A0ABR3VKW1_9PEZI